MKRGKNKKKEIRKREKIRKRKVKKKEEQKRKNSKKEKRRDKRYFVCACAVCMYARLRVNRKISKQKRYNQKCQSMRIQNIPHFLIQKY